MSIKDSLQELRTIDLSEIRADNIGRWPLIVRIIACVLAFIVVLVAFYFVKVKELNGDLDVARNQEQALRIDFANKARDAANLAAYQEQMVELQERLDVLVGQLPEDTEVPDLLDDVSETGLNSGLQIQSISLQDEVVHDFFVELPILIEASGGYHDFAGFVSGVAGLPRIVTLHDFTIENDDDNLLSLSILARTYRYKAPEDGADQ